MKRDLRAIRVLKAGSRLQKPLSCKYMLPFYEKGRMTQSELPRAQRVEPRTTEKNSWGVFESEWVLTKELLIFARLDFKTAVDQ